MLPLLTEKADSTCSSELRLYHSNLTVTTNYADSVAYDTVVILSSVAATFSGSVSVVSELADDSLCSRVGKDSAPSIRHCAISSSSYAPESCDSLRW